jgi:hypothetical protein
MLCCLYNSALDGMKRSPDIIDTNLESYLHDYQSSSAKRLALARGLFFFVRKSSTDEGKTDRWKRLDSIHSIRVSEIQNKKIPQLGYRNLLFLLAVLFVFLLGVDDNLFHALLWTIDSYPVPCSLSINIEAHIEPWHPC